MPAKNQLTIGSLFAGYGGLDLGIEAALDARTAWVSEIDPGACKVLAERFPDAPNLGDVTSIDWGTVPRVDIIAGGSPCQDLSTAGRRAGMTEGTRSNLWVAMREAVAQIKPTYVIWENVRGAYSASADSDLEPCAGCVGDGGNQPHLRALGRVLGDLADLGFDAQWHGLRAADIGAPHGRYRVFLLATRRGAASPIADAYDARPQGSHDPQGAAQARLHGYPVAGADGDAVKLLPTPRAAEAGQSMTAPAAMAHVESGNGSLSEPIGYYLPPTPVAQPSGNTPEDHLRKKPGRERVTDLAIIAENDLFTTGGKLLPTPNTMDGMKARSDEALARARMSGGCSNLKDVRPQEWGNYDAAIERWESTLGVKAPLPTEWTRSNNRTGEPKPRLSPRFVEWMMGLPEGWVTDIDGVSRASQLQMLGNGVVPQQAAAALRIMLNRTNQEVAA